MTAPLSPSSFAISPPLLLTFAIATAVQAALGGYAGLIVCMAGIILLHWRNRRRRQHLLQWSNQLDSTPPAALEGYDQFIANIYRQHRQLRKQKDQAHAVFDDWQTMLNALPFGVLRLDTELQLTWCNQRAEHLLQLNLPDDLGFRLSNILRSPAFMTYAEQSSSWEQGLELPLVDGSARLQLLSDRHQGAVLLVFPLQTVVLEDGSCTTQPWVDTGQRSSQQTAA